ncbi:MAG: aminoglycoside phosphotransferase family protein [Burkholderiales bacterium]
MDVTAADAKTVITASLRKLGLIAASAEAVMVPLTGGVSSDIWKVEAASGPLCVKRALPRLRVQQLWEAPVRRNAYEVAYMEFAQKVVPGGVPKILGHDPESGLFVMEYLAPEHHPIWKTQLRNGEVDTHTARAVGAQMASIHAAGANDSSIPNRFATDEIFYSIRLEPYLDATARIHSDLAPRLKQLADTTFQTKRVLVHGDIAPKNILVGPKRPIFLDCECAWFGDPAFDLAFCLNHLLLKCLLCRAARPELLTSFDALADTYLTGVTWEPRADMERRTAHLLPGLFLARVDGKSPVEYLNDEADKNKVRRCARRLLAEPVDRLKLIRDAWNTELEL